MNQYLESSEFYHRRYKNFSTLIIIPTSILFIMILIFISIGRININTKSTGEVVNNHKVITLVNSNNINSIKPNQKIHFLIKDNKDNNETIPGKILSVNNKPSMIKNELTYYKIKSILYPSKKEKRNLKLGLNGFITITKERKTILKYILNNFRK